MELRKLTIQDEKAYFKYIDSWQDEEIIPTSSRFSETTFESYLEKLRLHEGCLENRVPAETYFLFLDDGEISGAINCRYDLNEFLKNIGGHIGYGISPAYRGQRYAQWMLKEVFKYFKARDIDKIMLTADDVNIGSVRTIQSCGGKRTSSGRKNDGRSFGRYWIKLH